MAEVWMVKTRWGFIFEKKLADFVTDWQVSINGDLYCKVDGGTIYFDSFDLAKEYAITFLRGKIHRETLEVQDSKRILESVMAMTRESESAVGCHFD